MSDKKYVYALFHIPTKSFTVSLGYYGNENNILCFASKEACESFIATYSRKYEYRAKKMRVK